MSSRKPNLEDALAGVSGEFREKLIAAYADLKAASREGRYDLAGLQAGKFCEICLRLVQREVNKGPFTPFGVQIKNFAQECRNIIESPAPHVPESLKTIVPRALVFIYTVRNKRGIGHVGGDVQANLIDIATLARTADWVVCELIRIYYRTSLESAQAIVDSLAVREVPLVWAVADKKRVLRQGMTAKDQTLVLLHSEPESKADVSDLVAWVEYKSERHYPRDVLVPLHKSRLVEFDQERNVVYLSPEGALRVERQLIPS